MDNEYRGRLVKKLTRELGQNIQAALNGHDVLEIILNPDGRIWVERLGQPLECVDRMTAINARSLLNTIATSLGTEINLQQPILEGELIIDGSRFTGLIPPIVPAPSFCIRKKATRVIRLQEYQAAGILTEAAADILLTAIVAKANVLIVGGTGTGKTTFANALLAEIAQVDEQQRLVIIEDTPELQCNSPAQITLRTHGEITMQHLLKTTMRLRPDRIVVGEVRGAEALTLLKAWNTGHGGGLATVHANDARAALTRLEHLIAESGITQVAIEPLIAEGLDYLVSIEKVPLKQQSALGRNRQITEIARLAPYDKNKGYELESLFKLADTR